MVRATTVLLLVVVAATGPWTGAEGVGVGLTRVEVETQLGSLRGVVRQAGQGRNFYSFRGIPYARPPIDALRFKDPVVAEAWSGVRENFDPPVCPQYSVEPLLSGDLIVEGKEDCLYLHVYTPTVQEFNLPVMVYIHGGGYVLGGPDTTGGFPLPLLTRDVVLVSLQYRLGTLGFISTEDEVLPGNMGLKDQTLALRWVQDNIRNFGGDPAKVTIFGESAGGGSVHLQMLTPSASGLFQRAIMQSGNALCPWSLRGDHKKMAGVVGQTLGCSGLEDKTGALDSQALLTCLQQASVDQLVMVQSPGESWHLFPIYMAPRVDGEYLPDHPARLLREGRYNRVDVMLGVCAHEGASFAYVALETTAGEQLVANFSRLGPLVAGLDQEDAGLYLASRIFYHYLGSGRLNFSHDNVDTVAQMFGDLMFAVPHDIVSHFHTRDSIYGRKVYMYQLEHRGQHTLLEMFNTTLLDKEWVIHGDDLQYLFMKVFTNPELERRDDLVLQDIMLDLWTNFAATGNPTPDLSLGFRWSPASPSNLHYLSLMPAPVMRPDHRTQTRDFLLDLPTTQNKLLFPEKFTPDDTTTPSYCHA